MTFIRSKAVPDGHRLYTSVATIREWGASGQHDAGRESYDSRGWLVPPKPAHIQWKDYAPKRIRPSRSAPRLGSKEWIGSRITACLPGVTVRLPNDGPTLGWLAERDAAGTADRHGQHATRIERWMVEEKSPLILPLRLVKELLRPPVTAVNDNRPAGGEDEDVNNGTGAERVHNQGSITPSVPMLLAAYEDGVSNGGFSFIEGNVLLGSTNWRGKLTGLIFRNGELVAYGDYKGRKRRPAYTADPLGLVYNEKSETAKHVQAQPAEDRSYMRLKSAGTYLSAQSPEAPRSLAPPPRTARAVANDNVLARAITNTKVMPPVKRLPDGVAADYGRLAGISEMKGVGGASAGLHEVLTEMDRAEKLAAAGIDEVDLEVLDAVLDDASFRSIGMRFEHPESSASHEGRKIVERTLKKISEKIAA
ncbi:hypothetical protein KYK30_11165 [Shinella yambaruensis]|uniref:Uncharacterized protein n=1 Tax=Shinella yambaruensis TaxID=415996 RepID=A0ABQ5ZCM0_9HYPH|nr:hypothetical protein [Shinella yambaruensis]MCJ8028261.1 hypothetical protein [Shinella yambaruensis]MCU7980257.1 hypothetical protein [Shinella yambaruensis]GLR49226.1 hypothetical protein GCM10007923_04310 [Shinella yambaruensis]